MSVGKGVEKVSERYDIEMGKRIKKLRERKKLSLREAAKEIGMDYTYLSRVEKGYIPGTPKLRSIADYFSVDISYLLGDEVEVPEQLKGKISKWYTFIEEAERKEYTPEQIEELIDFLNKFKK